MVGGGQYARLDDHEADISDGSTTMLRAGVMRSGVLGVAVILLTVGAGCDGSTDDSGQTPPPEAPPTRTPDGGEIERLLGQVSVVDERPDVPGYDRDDFDWTDDHPGPGGHNGCDTRDDVLAAQLEQVSLADDGCTVLTGRLDDPYTGATVAFDIDRPDEVQIDHVVPLAYAWDMGAAEWSATERVTFGNDQRSELLAVDGSTNQDKSDSGPGDWLPPNESFHCAYAAAFLTVVTEYDLAITADDADALRDVAAGCG